MHVISSANHSSTNIYTTNKTSSYDRFLFDKHYFTTVCRYRFSKRRARFFDQCAAFFESNCQVYQCTYQIVY